MLFRRSVLLLLAAVGSLAFASTQPSVECLALLARKARSGRIGRPFLVNTAKGLEIPLGEDAGTRYTFVVPTGASPTSRGPNGGVVGLRAVSDGKTASFSPLVTMPIPDEGQRQLVLWFDAEALKALGFPGDAARLKLLVVFLEKVVTVNDRFETSVVSLPADDRERTFSGAAERLTGSNREAAERRDRYFRRIEREGRDTDLTDAVMRAWEEALSGMD